MVNMGELFTYSRIPDVPMDRVMVSETEGKKYFLLSGDLLFARQSLVLEGAGRCSIFMGSKEPVTYEGHLIRARMNRQIANPLFYYYFFRSFSGRATMASIVEQVAAAGIRASDLTRLHVPHPSLADQTAIARILGILDDKIDLSRRVNETSEAMARALFKSWFVDFDPVRAKAEGRSHSIPKVLADKFPVRMVDSDLGEIPEEWQIGRLGDLVSATKGRSYRSDELTESDTAMVTLKSFVRKGGYRPDGLKSFKGEYKPDQIVKPGEIVIACTDVTQAAEVVGRPAIVLATERFRTLVASLDALIVRPLDTRVSVPFLYFLGGTEAFVSHTYSYTSGTTVLHLSKDAVPSFRFPLPPAGLVKLFDSVADVALRQMQATASESSTLFSLRDTLLPKLISGELGIKDAEKFIARRL
ncbi:MAG: restriction endonuclease subunit S [Spirochaetia bacterium]|jgi:type I restriction enzyme S subunit